MRLLPLLFLLTACPAPKDTSDTGSEADADADPRDGTYTGSFSIDVVAPQNAAITEGPLQVNFTIAFTATRYT